MSPRGSVATASAPRTGRKLKTAVETIWHDPATSKWLVLPAGTPCELIEPDKLAPLVGAEESRELLKAKSDVESSRKRRDHGPASLVMLAGRVRVLRNDDLE